MANKTVVLACIALGASVVLSGLTAPAQAAVAVDMSAMVANMDTTAPKYATPECVEARAAATNYDSNVAGRIATGAALGLALGIFGLPAAIGVDNDEAKRATFVVQGLAEKCGAEAVMPYMRQLAEKGDDDAMAWIGQAYMEKQDWPHAAEWFQRAADKNNAIGETNLGTLYAHGNGVTADPARAVALWQKAASHGSDAARLNLGLMYEDARDYPKAAEMYLDAAKHGIGGAAFHLGLFYEQGWGVERSDRAAFGWFSIAALRNYPDAVARRGAVAARLTQGDIEDTARVIERCYHGGRCNF